MKITRKIVFILCYDQRVLEHMCKYFICNIPRNSVMDTCTPPNVPIRFQFDELRKIDPNHLPYHRAFYISCHNLNQNPTKSHHKIDNFWVFFLAVIPGCYSFNIENWWNLFRRLWYGFSTKPSMKERYMFILNTCFESQVIIIQRVSRYFFFRIDPKNRNGARVSAQLTDRKRFISFKDLQSVPLFSFVYYYLCGVVIKNIYSNRHQTFTCRILGWTAELNAKESNGIIILVWLQSLQPTSIFEYIARLGVCVSLCACT